MKTDLSSCTAIITGGSKGFGAGTAKALKDEGVDVWITGRDEEALSIKAKQIGVKTFVGDVTNPKDWDELFENVLKSSGRLDILVNNAGGAGEVKLIDEIDDNEIIQNISTNLTGALLGCRRAAKIMKKQKSGIIVNVASTCARHAWPRFPIYSAAKSGLVQASRCIYAGLREHGVRVTSLIPSWGATDFRLSANQPEHPPEIEAQCIQPEDFGELVVQICSLPAHLEIQDMTVWPLVQEVIPF